MKTSFLTLALAAALPLAAQAQALVFAGGKSFRVHESPSIAVSADQGKTWTLAYEGARKGQDNPSWVTALAYGANKIVAVTNYGLVLTSSDKGKTWAAQNVKAALKLNGGFNGVAYGNGLFVAAGEQDALAFSADGEHWQRLGTDNLAGATTSSTPAAAEAKQTAKSRLGGLGGKLGGLGGGLMGQATSATKTSGAAPATDMNAFHTNTDPHDETKYTHTYGVDFIDGKFYLAGNFGREAVFVAEGGRIKRVAVSRIHDKMTSSLRKTAGDGKGHIVAFAEAEMQSATSADGGQTWEEDFDLKPRLQGGSYAAGKFVGVSAFGDVATSADGHTWAVRNLGSMNAGGSLTDVAYTGKNWVLCGIDNSTWLSADQGKTWSRTESKGLSLKRLLVVQ